MTTKECSIELVRKIWDHEDGVSILVATDPEFPEEFVRITTMHDETSKIYFGEVDISLTRAMARLLGQALIDQAGQV